MYFRLYPNKNNTIFRYVTYDKTYTNVLKKQGENINAGANPIMEMMDGKGESRLVFSFVLPDWLKTKLTMYDYKVNIQLWDAGTLYSPPIKMKNIMLESFIEDFVEGDGYSFLYPENKSGVSNFIYRDSINKWEDVGFTPITSYHLNRINEDLNFEVTSTIANTLTNSTNANFSVRIDNRENDNVNIYRKFIHSKYTMTVFKPYLEFFIEDEIIDSSYNFYSETTNRVYLLNQKGVDFTNTVAAEVTEEGGTTSTLAATNLGAGVYYIDITPTAITSLKPKVCTIIWKIGTLAVQKNMIHIKNINQLDSVNYDNLFFYPVTASTHNILRQGDIIPFSVVSEIRGKGGVVLDSYEYRITSADGFEMCPWMPVSAYRYDMYFYINTEYFYPEQQYEVWLRNKTDNFTITSNQTYKFKLAMNDKSHLRQLSTSPYYSREQFLGK